MRTMGKIPGLSILCLLLTVNISWADTHSWTRYEQPDKTIDSRVCPLEGLIFSCFGAYCSDGVLRSYFTNLGFKHEEAGKTKLGPVTITLSAGGKTLGTVTGRRIIPKDKRWDKGYVQIDLDGKPYISIYVAWHEAGGDLTATLPDGRSTSFAIKYARSALIAAEKACHKNQ